MHRGFFSKTTRDDSARLASFPSRLSLFKATNLLPH
jgi:hypothetical protein